MNREEQTQLIEKLVTELAKSRTCENCAFLTEMGINCEVFDIAMERFMLKDVSTFGCNSFVSTDIKGK